MRLIVLLDFLFYLFIGLRNIRYTSIGFNVVLEFTDFFNRLQFYLYICITQRKKTKFVLFNNSYCIL